MPAAKLWPEAVKTASSRQKYRVHLLQLSVFLFDREKDSMLAELHQRLELLLPQRGPGDAPALPWHDHEATGSAADRARRRIADLEAHASQLEVKHGSLKSSKPKTGGRVSTDAERIADTSGKLCLQIDPSWSIHHKSRGRLPESKSDSVKQQ